MRPFSRIHHHSLPKAVIHIRRHCFGRRRLEEVGFLILIKVFRNIQRHGYKQKQAHPSLLSCFILVACAPMLADKAGSAPEPGHDWSQTAERSPLVGLSVFMLPGAGAETEPAANKQSRPRGNLFSEQKEAQSVSLSYFLTVKKKKMSLYSSQRSSKPSLVSSAFC